MSRVGPGLGRVFANLAAAALAALLSLPDARAAQDAAPTAQGVPSAPASLADLLVAARRWLDAGEAEAAFHALDARVGDYAGDPEFDYLLGLAALDSRRPGQAVFALERALMVRPDFLQARAEIARAYFEIRERENARREFETVAGQRIPEEARRVIGRYLDAIRRVEDRGRARWNALVELEAGYDSNPNFGSSSGEWILADGTAVIPLGISRPRSSAVWAAAAGMDWSVPIGGAWHWTVGGRASARRHPSAHTLDQDQFDLATGFAYRSGCHQINMLAQSQHLELGGAGFRNAVGALGQWQCDLDARTRVGAYGQYFVFDFPNEAARDADRSALGLTFARVLDGAGRPIVVGTLHGGSETSRRDLDNLSYDFRGARIAFSRGLGSNWRGFASVSYERRDFDGIEPFFGVTRHDRQGELRIGAERPFAGRWSIAPTIAYTRNRSSVVPNDFRRTQAGVILRYRLR